MLSLEIGAVFENRFKIISSLGQGGFAKTFLAEDIKTNSMVVLKFPDIAQLGDPAVYERFRREIAIGELLNHPDLPRALTYSEGNPPFLVLNYVEGESIASVMNNGRKFTVEEVIELSSNLLDVLQYCHEKGICHRDIKPENLLLGTDGRIKIIDFGIAGLEGAPRVTYRGFSGLMGTPEYMSPEQIKGERGGPRSDIYAIGCLMYYLLAGTPPYTGDNPLTVMYQHMTANMKPLTEIRNDVTKNLFAVIKKSLRRRKEERYASAKDMAYDLRNLQVVDVSILSKQDPPLASAATTKKSSWILIICSIVLVLAVLILIIVLK